MKLDIACGQNKRQGFKGVDIVPGEGVDFVWDLEKFPWGPFKNNSVEEVNVSHYAEHTRDLIKFMDEVWRICRHDVKVTIVSPYYTSIRAWMDPTHVRAISENTWLYFNKSWRESVKLEHYPIKSNYNIEKMYTFFNPPWDKKSDEARQFAQTHYWNVISDIVVELRTIK
ncbi:MAG: type 11 methyltransferase [Parcubacteria group bacterium Licking1014_17]|nr:MAG: type 11 methyltransferase [Parcubacteria group bacterium Licking1014_17]